MSRKRSAVLAVVFFLVAAFLYSESFSCGERAAQVISSVQASEIQSAPSTGRFMFGAAKDRCFVIDTATGAVVEILSDEMVQLNLARNPRY